MQHISYLALWGRPWGISALCHTLFFKPPLGAPSVRLVCLFVCLSPKCKKMQFFQKQSNLQLWSLLTRCFKKKLPPKTFWNIFTSVKSFCVKFCKFVGNLYAKFYSLLFYNSNMAANTPRNH